MNRIGRAIYNNFKIKRDQNKEWDLFQLQEIQTIGTYCFHNLERNKFQQIDIDRNFFKISIQQTIWRFQVSSNFMRIQQYLIYELFSRVN